MFASRTSVPELSNCKWESRACGTTENNSLFLLFSRHSWVLLVEDHGRFGQKTNGFEGSLVPALGSNSVVRGLGRWSQRGPVHRDPYARRSPPPDGQNGFSGFSPDHGCKANKWVSLRCTFPTNMTGKTKSPATETAPPPATTQGSNSSNLEVALEVEPRKPRLAWQGMDRREAAVSVPTQVVEIVRPGKAQAGDDLLPGLAASHQRVRGEIQHPNRLIWTNDNLVALQSLLDERDPATKDYRYRGKVDLVYINPPFMVNNDFLADNAIDIDLDEDAHVTAKKEPSLVEILAYRDTCDKALIPS